MNIFIWRNIITEMATAIWKGSLGESPASTILINCIHLHSPSLSFVFHGPILPFLVYSHCSHQCCSCLKQAAVFSDKALNTPLHVICETPNCRQAQLVCSCPFHSISPAGRQEFMKTNTELKEGGLEFLWMPKWTVSLFTS